MIPLCLIFLLMVSVTLIVMTSAATTSAEGPQWLNSKNTQNSLPSVHDNDGYLSEESGIGIFLEADTILRRYKEKRGEDVCRTDDFRFAETCIVEAQRKCSDPRSSCLCSNGCPQKIDLVDEYQRAFLNGGSSPHQNFLASVEKVFQTRSWDSYNNREMASLLPIEALTKNQAQKSLGLLAPNDILAFQDLYHALQLQQNLLWENCDLAPCSCTDIVECRLINARGRVHITAIVIYFGADFQAARSPIQLPQSLGNLRHLERFLLLCSQGVQLPPTLSRLKALRSVTISVSSSNPIPKLGQAPNLKALMLEVGILKSSALSIDQFIIPEICRMHSLRFLRIGPGLAARRFPECVTYNNVNLIRLDISGATLPGPLPPSFARLTQLRSFVAFEMGMQACLPSDSSLARDCRPSFKSRARVHFDEDVRTVLM